jgi:hypothetical protein
VIVSHNGEPFLFENTPFRGPQLRRLDHRLLASRSKHIAVHGLIPRDVYSAQERRDLYNLHKSIIDDPDLHRSQRNELMCQYGSFATYFARKLVALVSQDTPFLCCNTRFMMNFYGSKFRYARDDHTDVISLQNIVDQNFHLRYKMKEHELEHVTSDQELMAIYEANDQLPRISVGQSVMLRT